MARNQSELGGTIVHLGYVRKLIENSLSSQPWRLYLRGSHLCLTVSTPPGQDGLLTLIRAPIPSQVRAQQNVRGQIRGSKFLNYLHWHSGRVMLFGATWEIPLWSPWWGKFPENGNSKCASGKAAWLIITWDTEWDQTSTEYWCWKQKICPLSLSECKLLLQRADFIIKNWYWPSVRGRLPRGSDPLSDLNISLSWCWIMHRYFFFVLILILFIIPLSVAYSLCYNKGFLSSTDIVCSVNAVLLRFGVFQGEYMNLSHWKRGVVESGTCYFINSWTALSDLCSRCCREPSRHFFSLKNSLVLRNELSFKKVKTLIMLIGF